MVVLLESDLIADRLLLPDQDLIALAVGEVIVAFTSRHEVDLNDEVALVPGGPRPVAELTSRPDAPVPGPLPVGLVGLVVGLQPATSLAGPAGTGLHILNEVPDGDAVILRVFAGDTPVLADLEFEVRRAAVEAMFG